MYFFIFLSCGLTLALAGYSHHDDQYHYYHDDQYDNYNNDYQYDSHNDDGQYSSHLEYNEYNRYHGPLHYPVIGPHGVPVEPHAVQAARAQHLAAHSKEFSHNGWIPHNNYHPQEYNEHNKYHGPLHIPVINHHGVPVEPHAVQAARAQHLAAHSKEFSHNGWIPHNNYHPQEYNEHNKYHGPLHIPVINHHGVPVEPHAVQAARALHLSTHAKESSHSGWIPHKTYGGHYQYNNNQQYNEHNKYHGPLHIPVINHHGVPVEPHAVQAARAKHLAAHNKGYGF